LGPRLLSVFFSFRSPARVGVPSTTFFLFFLFLGSIRRTRSDLSLPLGSLQFGSLRGPSFFPCPLPSSLSLSELPDSQRPLPLPFCATVIYIQALSVFFLSGHPAPLFGPIALRPSVHGLRFVGGFFFNTALGFLLVLSRLPLVCVDTPTGRDAAFAILFPPLPPRPLFQVDLCPCLLLPPSHFSSAPLS